MSVCRSDIEPFMLSPCCACSCFSDVPAVLFTYFGCSKYLRLCVLVLLPLPLCEIVNISLLTIDLTCLVDSKCVSKLICSDLCCVHLQVISVVRLHQTQLQGLYYCLLAFSSLLDWSSAYRGGSPTSQVQVNKTFHTGPYGQFAYTG